MTNYIALRGHIYSDSNPLTYEWSKLGSRFFPKSLVSNSENILRFLSLGFRPNRTDVKNILSGLKRVEHKQKGYLLQVTIDPDQHHFLYRTLAPIKTDEGRLQELLRIHDMWVLFFGSAIYSENPIKILLESSKYEIEWPAAVSDNFIDLKNEESSQENSLTDKNLTKEENQVDRQKVKNNPAEKGNVSRKSPSEDKLDRDDEKPSGMSKGLLADVIKR